MLQERDEVMDEYTSSSSSVSSSSWRHATTLSSVHDADAEPNLPVGVYSTLGRLLPASFVHCAPGTPLSPPLLPPPLAGIRRSRACDVKLERVPTPTRADRLFVAPGDEHDVRICFPRLVSRSRPAEVEEAKLVVMPNDSAAASDSRAKSGATCQPSYYQHNRVEVRDVARQVVPMSSAWADAVNDNARQPTVVNLATSDKTIQRSRPSGAGRDEEDEKRLAQTAAAENFLPTAIHRRLPRPPGYRWTTGGPPQEQQHQQRRRRSVQLDAKYWERRRKNNEAAKRSRDIRRANERRVAQRAALLERENARLRSEVGALTDDALRLHYYLLCSRAFRCSHCAVSPHESD